jgi:oligopeptidase B
MTMNHKDNAPLAPVAKRVPTTLNIHDVTLTDDFGWLRMRDLEQPDPEVLAHLTAENTYAEAMMAHTSVLQSNLLAEFESRPDEFLNSAPVQEGRYDYWERIPEGSQYKVLYRRRRAQGSAVEVVLDLNEMAKGHKFLELDDVAYSDSGNFVAYTVDTNGYGQNTLFVKNLLTGKTGPALAERVTGVVWAADNRTLFFTTEDETTKRSNKLFRVRRNGKRPHFLLEESDELYGLGVNRSRDGKVIFAAATSYEATEYRYLDASAPANPLRLIAKRQDGHRYYVDHFDRRFYIRTNDGAKNFRLVSTAVSRPGRTNWKEEIAHRPEVLLEEVVFFSRHMVVFERDNGLEKVRIVDNRTGSARYLEFPERIYNIGALDEAELFHDLNREFDSHVLRLRYDSFSTPPTIFDYDMGSGERTVVEALVVPGHDSSQYHSEMTYATARDGTKVPVVVSWKGDLVKDGKRPLYLYGYGAYGMCALWAGQFRMSRLSLLDRGVVFACAYIRGGGELGEPWHEAGKMLNKLNTFTDFIDSADHLIAEKYGSRDRFVIEGRSAGGLLMGVVVNMRPDLCKAAVMGVPFVDVINTMLDDTLPLTTGEFIEWGNPKELEYFRYMLSYSPYDNVCAQNYPTLLIHSALRDSAVPYWEPAKIAAKLRAMKTDNNPLLFRILLEGGGHGGLSGRTDRFKEEAFRFAFILDQLGIGS